MGRILIFIFGVVSYCVFFASFLYAIAFVAGLDQFEFVPYTIDKGGPLVPFGEALLINALLLGLFAVQHNIMARIWFKKIWTKIVPEPMERSVFVLLSSLILFLMYWNWRPMPEVVWDVSGSTLGTVLTVGLYLGFVIVLISTFLIDHFDLFGLRQIWLHLQKKEYTPVEFQTTGLYSYVRHPLMLGFIIAFWCTPTMTMGHLIFAIATTAFMFLGMVLEEQDTAKLLGDPYVQYRKQVSMIIPMPAKKG
jgi:protein-S-isoprenylcysteine O-methyltransferase Ste14